MKKQRSRSSTEKGKPMKAGSAQDWIGTHGRDKAQNMSCTAKKIYVFIIVKWILGPVLSPPPPPRNLASAQQGIFMAKSGKSLVPASFQVQRFCFLPTTLQTVRVILALLKWRHFKKLQLVTPSWSSLFFLYSVFLRITSPSTALPPEFWRWWNRDLGSGELTELTHLTEWTELEF